MATPSPEAAATTPVTPHLELVDGEAPAGAPDHEPIPSRIGRFNVLKRLGSGGMGVVYVAYDGDLGRKVALKVLRTAAFTVGKRDKARRRLWREAQAMAQLSHPNVIAIYDVGSVDDQIFLAMEFVKGVTLTKWLRSAEGPSGPRRRTWQEVVVVFVQAGRGLSAAHRAGIIHRDFKPDNVLIDAEGRVRVGDFGLARGGILDPPDRPDTFTEAIKVLSEKSMLDMRITRTGGMTGTPAYMAPEQYLGQPTDARTDQFSFCVALYEGLYGQRPFVGERVSVVREAVIAGRVQEVPKDVDVPDWLHRLVLRGLSVRPGDRFRDMDELLDRLTNRPRPPLARVRVLLLGGLAVALAAAAAWALAPGPAAAPAAGPDCPAPELAWDDARRAALGRALAARPGGDALGPAVLAALDARAADLRDRFSTTCSEDQPDERRAACLERRRTAFVGLAAALAEVSGPALDRAAAAVDALPPARECDDPQALSGVAPPPADPALRGRLRRQAEDLDRVAALLALGEPNRARDGAQAQLAVAAREEHLPARARALYVRAALERATGRAPEAERTLEEALWAAEASRHDEVAADALLLLLELESEDLGRRGEARRLWSRLSATLRRLGDVGRREVAALGRYGRALLREGDAHAAHDQLTAALRRGEQVLGPRHPGLVPLLLDLAAAAQKLDRQDEAARRAAEADELAAAALPPDHPDRARALVVAGDLARARGELTPARARYDQALAIYTRIHGQDHADMSPALLGRGLAAAGELRWAEAAEDLRRSIHGWEHLHGPDYPRLVEPLTALCAVESALGEHAPAQRACGRAITLATRAQAPAQAAVARFALARAITAEASARGDATPETRAQALTVAQQAQDDAVRAEDAALAAAISGWLAAQRRLAPPDLPDPSGMP